MLRLLGCLLLVFGSLNLQGQGKHRFVPAKILMQTGDTIVTELRLPIKNDWKAKIHIRKEGSKKTKSIAMNSIDYMLLKTKDGVMMFQYFDRAIRNAKKEKQKKARGLFLVDLLCENISAYKLIAGISIDKQQNIYETYLDGIGHYFLKRPRESAPTMVGFIAISKIPNRKMVAKRRKKMLDEYFKNDRTWSKKLNKTDRVTHEELVEMLLESCESN